MEGIVSWPQLIFIAGMIVMVAVFTFAFAWRAQEFRARDRHDQRTLFLQEIASVHDVIKMVQKDLDSRLRSIEMSNAGTLVMLKHIEEFKKEVMDRFETMNEDRSKDMEILNRRLDAVHNASRLFTIESSND